MFQLFFQVELFCIDHLLMVEITATEESLIFDFMFPTTRPDGTLRGQNEADEAVTGLEAVLQVTRCILSGYIWEEDAFKRACQGFNQVKFLRYRFLAFQNHKIFMIWAKLKKSI